MRFVVDAQLPPALARFLTSLGHQAEHVADVGLRDAADSVVWSYAYKCQAVLITKDEDFPRRRHQSNDGPVVVWLRIKNSSRRALLQWIEPLLPHIEAMVQQGELLVEIR